MRYDPAIKKATLTLDPSADLELSASYMATVEGGSSGAEDVAADPLAEDERWSFAPANHPTPPRRI